MLRLSFPCRQCQILFPTRDERDAHLRTVHHSFDGREEIKGDRRDVGERRKAPLSAGTAAAAVANDPERHRQQHHQCPDCSFPCGSADDLQVHRLTAHYHRPHQQENQQPPPACGAGQPFSFDRVAEAVTRRRYNDYYSTGRFRGIQGENNSCYLDASLVALFYAETAFDSLLLVVPESSNNSRSRSRSNNSITCSNEKNVQYARTYLTLHIVNQLRTRHFVPGALVVEWRRMIAGWFGGTTTTTTSSSSSEYCAHEEACEFIRFLVHTFGQDDDASSLRFVLAPSSSSDRRRAAVVSSDDNGDDGEAMLQLLAPSSSSARSPAAPGGATIWTTAQLLHNTLEAERLSFRRLGASLILQLPRYGKDHEHRVLSAVVPSPCLYVTNNTDTTTKARYELSSLLVIGRSHFVSYMRIARDSETSNDSSSCNNKDSCQTVTTWLYFDSMHARENEINVPVIEDVSHQLQILEAPNAATLVPSRMRAGGMEHLKRVVEDLSIAIYTRSAPNGNR